MGMKDAINGQRSVVNNLNGIVYDFKKNIDSINKIINSINSSWKSDAGEKYYIIASLQNVRIQLGKNIGNVAKFCLYAKKYISDIEKFEEFKGAYFDTPVISVTSVQNSKSCKTKIQCDTKALKDVALEIMNCADSIQIRAESIKNQVKKLDNSIVSKVSSRKTVNGYYTSFANQATALKNISNALKSIAYNYESSEQIVFQSVSAIKSGKFNEIQAMAQNASSSLKTSIGGLVTYNSGNLIVDIMNQFDDEWDAMPETLKTFLKQNSYIKKAKKYYDVIDKFRKGKWVEGVETIYGIFGKAYDKKSNTINWGSLKVMAVLKTIELAADPNGYLQQYVRKYEDLAVEVGSKGNIAQMLYYVSAETIQVLGKGTTDVCCKLIDQTIHSVPVLGDSLDWCNAITKDVFGYGVPGQLMNDVGTHISNGVDFVIDNGGKIIGNVEKSTRKYVSKKIGQIGNGIKCAFRWL